MPGIDRHFLWTSTKVNLQVHCWCLTGNPKIFMKTTTSLLSQAVQLWEWGEAQGGPPSVHLPWATKIIYFCYVPGLKSTQRGSQIDRRVKIYAHIFSGFFEAYFIYKIFCLKSVLLLHQKWSPSLNGSCTSQIEPFIIAPSIANHCLSVWHHCRNFLWKFP